MSRIIRVIDNETIEISDYRNSGYLFDHNAPTIEDIRKQISNIDDWCVFKETINPFVLYGEKEELQQRIDKAIEYIYKFEDRIDKTTKILEMSALNKGICTTNEIDTIQKALDILRGKDEFKKSN